MSVMVGRSDLTVRPGHQPSARTPYNMHVITAKRRGGRGDPAAGAAPGRDVAGYRDATRADGYELARHMRS